MELKTVKEICKAFADGEDIQWRWNRLPNDGWQNLQQYDPRFLNVDLINKHFRTKPKTKVIKYRTFLSKFFSRDGVGVCHWEDNLKNPREKLDIFVKWLGDWQEVEVNVEE